MGFGRPGEEQKPGEGAKRWPRQGSLQQRPKEQSGWICVRVNFWAGCCWDPNKRLTSSSDTRRLRHVLGHERGE